MSIVTPLRRRPFAPSAVIFPIACHRLLFFQSPLLIKKDTYETAQLLLDMYGELAIVLPH